MSSRGVLSRFLGVWSSDVCSSELLATGASLTGVTVIETVAVPLHLGSATGGEPVVPLSQELGGAAWREGAQTSGVDVSLKKELRVTLPWAGLLSLVAVRALPSASVSFARTLAAVLFKQETVPALARGVEFRLAAGASLTGVTVMETVAVPLHLGSATGGEPVVPLSQ